MNNQKPSVSVNIAAQPIHACDCGNISYMQAFQLRYLPAMLSPSGNEELVPIPGYLCMQCGKPGKISDADRMSQYKK